MFGPFFKNHCFLCGPALPGTVAPFYTEFSSRSVQPFKTVYWVFVQFIYKPFSHSLSLNWPYKTNAAWNGHVDNRLLLLAWKNNQTIQFINSNRDLFVFVTFVEVIGPFRSRWWQKVKTQTSVTCMCLGRDRRSKRKLLCTCLDHDRRWKRKVRWHV